MLILKIEIGILKMALLARATGSVFFLSNNSYSKLIPKCSKAKLYKKHSLKVLAPDRHLCNIRFLYNHSSETHASKSKYVLYDEYIESRRKEARRSVLIEVQSEKSCNDVYNYCSQFGKINGLFHYTNSGTDRHFVLIEYTSEESIQTVLTSSTHFNFEQIIPVQSVLLWFRNTSRTEKKISNAEVIPFQKNSCKVLSNVDIFKMLTTAESISDQILLLYNKTRLNDVGSRLRFFTAYQIEHSFKGFFPNMAVLPFGSSVNGYGKQNCDLDLSVVLEKNKKEINSSRLVFQSKSALIYERHEVKKLLQIIADAMYGFMPGISNVRKILEARVPIVKFDHILTGIECDLSMTNMTAYYMSELMYMFGEIDERVRPLIFTVRKWAQSMKLTSKNIPGPWIANFPLSLMVLFFLQQKKILPDLNLLKTSASKQDIRIADIYVDCTFQRDINKIPKITDRPNTETLEDLLMDFFTYYGNFDFETKAISIREGKAVSKPDYSPLYICNPLETNLNASKNVNSEELEKIKIAIRSAAWKMESKEDKSDNWGLVNLLVQKTVYKNKFVTTVRSKQKTVDFQALFQDEEALSTSKQKTDFSRRQNKSKTKLP